MATLARKLALITGSTSGIGLGIAHKLAKQGCDVVLNGFGSISEISDHLQQFEKIYQVKAYYDPADLSKVEDIEAMMHKFTSGKNCVDILVNNAGIQHTASVEQFPVERWNAIININLSAVFHTTRLALPSMKAKNWGRIINIASVHGLIASTNKSAYVAAKHGVIGFTKAVALENAQTGITCNAICPGWVLTPLVQKQIEDRANKNNITNEEAKKSLLGEKQPSHQFVTPAQLGDLTVFLASDSASQVQGVAWQMDGGWTAQ
jgi:3-hydroxybutyrate dehydrogenase